MWVDFKNAVQSVIDKAGHGAHVFYWPEKGFMVKRDSKNGISAEQTITMAPDHYAGFFSNTTFTDKITHEKVTILVDREHVKRELKYVVDNPPESSRTGRSLVGVIACEYKLHRNKETA